MRKTSLILAIFAIIVCSPISVHAMTVRSGEQVNVKATDEVKGSLIVVGDNVTVDKQIDGDLLCAGQKVTVNAPVSGDVMCASGSLTVNAPVAGQIIKQGITSGSSFNWAQLWILARLIGLFSALLLGLIIIHWFRRQAVNVVDTMVIKTKASILTGLLFLILMPIAGCLLLVTVLGIPLAMIVFLTWLLIMLISKVIFGIALGKMFWRHYRHKPTKVGKQRNAEAKLFYPALVGIISATIIFALPVIGAVFCVIATAWVMGAIWLNCRAK